MGKRPHTSTTERDRWLRCDERQRRASKPPRRRNMSQTNLGRCLHGMTATSTFRIPKARITGLYGRMLTAYARRTWGQVPDNAYVLWHNQKVMNATFKHEQRIATFDALDRDLSALAQAVTAATVGCSWCLDFGYYLAHSEGMDLEKIREVMRWRDSDVFTPARAEGAGVRRGDVGHATHGHRRDGRGAARGAGRGGDGRADDDDRDREPARSVQLGGRDPGAGLLRRVRDPHPRTSPPSTTYGRTHERGPDDGHRRLRQAPEPAVHRRLRDARLGGRRRGRAPGDLAALGRGRPRRGARRAGVPRPDHHSPLAQPPADPDAAAGDVRRPVAARAVAHDARRGRRRRARRQRLDRDARRAGDADAHRARGVRAAGGLRRPVRRDRRRRRQVTGRGTSDRAPGPQPRRGPAAARAGGAAGSGRRSSTGSCWRWSPATSSP